MVSNASDLLGTAIPGFFSGVQLALQSEVGRRSGPHKLRRLAGKLNQPYPDTTAGTSTDENDSSYKHSPDQLP